MTQTLFGTDGIRTHVGKVPLTPQTAMQLGTALGYWITQIYKGKKIIIGHDTRLSCPLLKAAITTGLLQHNVALYDVGTISTPALYWLTTTCDYDIGIMITASHNAYHDNGIKIFTHHHGKTRPEDEQEISRLYHTLSYEPDYDALGTYEQAPLLVTGYIKALLETSCVALPHTIKIVLDCAHGAYATIAPHVIAQTGATIITLNNQPDGKNINHQCGSESPAALQQAVLEHNAAIGFAFDGDGDRIIAVTHDGTIKTGDDLLAFLTTHPTYQTEKTIVGTIMTNQGLAQHLLAKNKHLMRTPVGDKHVIQAMKSSNFLLGGEPSGHIILRDFNSTADALFVTLRLLETAQLTTNWHMHTFTKFPHIIINVPVAFKKDLTTQPYATLIEQSEKKLLNGRLVVRYSGTESLLRVMAEAPDKDNAQEVCTALSQTLVYELSKEQT